MWPFFGFRSMSTTREDRERLSRPESVPMLYAKIKMRAQALRSYLQLGYAKPATQR